MGVAVGEAVGLPSVPWPVIIGAVDAEAVAAVDSVERTTTDRAEVILAVDSGTSVRVRLLGSEMTAGVRYACSTVARFSCTRHTGWYPLAQNIWYEGQGHSVGRSTKGSVVTET